MIDAIAFGKITIKGQAYTTDVRIFADGKVLDGWWRQHGHRLTLQDLADLLGEQPEVLVVGTGIYGRMLPESGLEQTIRDMGIELLVAPNDQAMMHFNHQFASRKTVGCFHLTC